MSEGSGSPYDKFASFMESYDHLLGKFRAREHPGKLYQRIEEATEDLQDMDREFIGSTLGVGQLLEEVDQTLSDLKQHVEGNSDYTGEVSFERYNRDLMRTYERLDEAARSFGI